MFELRKIEDVELAFDSQEEIEVALSNEALVEEIKLKSDIYMDTISDFVESLEESFPYADMEALILQIVSLLVDPTVGISDLDTGGYSNIVSGDAVRKGLNEMYAKKQKSEVLNTAKLSMSTVRIATMHDLIRVVSSLPWFSTTFEMQPDRWKFASHLIARLEDVFFHIVQLNAKIEFKVIEWNDGSWLYSPTNGIKDLILVPSECKIYQSDIYNCAKIFRTTMFVAFDFGQSAEDIGASTFDISHFPMICEPKDWTEEEAGGYLTPIHSKSTKKRGASEQPQNVLNVLNRFQHNAFILANHVSYAEYTAYIRAKIEPQYEHLSIPEAELRVRSIIRNSTSGFEYVTSWYQDEYGTKKPFYLEFQYDFRGRTYSTGFNINLQADTYRKAMILPAESNFNRDTYAIEIPNPQGY